MLSGGNTRNNNANYNKYKAHTTDHPVCKCDCMHVRTCRLQCIVLLLIVNDVVHVTGQRLTLEFSFVLIVGTGPWPKSPSPWGRMAGYATTSSAANSLVTED